MVRSTRRLAVLVLGCAVTAAGLVMMVTPGPGLVVIIAGLAILATEFTWAEILLERARKQAVRAKNVAVRKAGGLRRRTRRLRVRVGQQVTEVTVTELVEYGPPAPATPELPAAERAPSRVESLTVVDLTTSIRAAEPDPAGSWQDADDDRQDADGGSRR
jgi:uncharacterized protein (TIGR02611 family)